MKISISHDLYMKMARTHHLAPVIIFGSLSLLQTLAAIVWGGFSPAKMILLYLAGFCMWTVVEYVLHRFPFHYVTEKEPLRLLTGGLHLLHHEIPNRGDYVVSPILLSTPFYLLISGLLYLITKNIFSTALFMAGLALAYLCYEWVHYSTHHRVAKTSFGKYLKRHHMMHHFKDSQNYFGVTSPFWDWMFGTLPKNDEQRDTTILPILSREPG